MTRYYETGNLRRGYCNELIPLTITTGHHCTVCSAPAAANGRRSVWRPGRASDQGETQSSQLLGSVAGAGGGRAATATGGASRSGGAFSESENFRGVSV